MELTESNYMELTESNYMEIWLHAELHLYYYYMYIFFYFFATVSSICATMSREIKIPLAVALCGHSTPRKTTHLSRDVYEYYAT